MTKQQRQKMLKLASKYTEGTQPDFFLCRSMDQEGIGSLVKEFTEFYEHGQGGRRAGKSTWASGEYPSHFRSYRTPIRNDLILSFKAMLILLFVEAGGMKGLGE